MDVLQQVLQLVLDDVQLYLQYVGLLLVLCQFDGVGEVLICIIGLDLNVFVVYLMQVYLVIGCNDFDEVQ